MNTPHSDSLAAKLATAKTSWTKAESKVARAMRAWRQDDVHPEDLRRDLAHAQSVLTTVQAHRDKIAVRLLLSQQIVPVTRNDRQFLEVRGLSTEHAFALMTRIKVSGHEASLALTSDLSDDESKVVLIRYFGGESGAGEMESRVIHAMAAVARVTAVA